jgi:hypothetical protein
LIDRLSGLAIDVHRATQQLRGPRPEWD